MCRMDELFAYLKTLPDLAAREAFATACGTSLGHLRNCKSEGKRVSPITCVTIEAATFGRVMRWHLRDDWRAIWPELRSRPDAPKQTRKTATA
jgi:DNA-binding transcriptional regulator YdaS (Cro superfamily)